MSELQGVVTNLNVAVKNVQNGTARLPEITDAVANEAKDLPGLVLQTQTSMRELERLIEAMQRHWLLRKYVNKTNPPPLRPLSETAGAGKEAGEGAPFAEGFCQGDQGRVTPHSKGPDPGRSVAPVIERRTHK